MPRFERVFLVSSVKSRARALTSLPLPAQKRNVFRGHARLWQAFSGTCCQTEHHAILLHMFILSDNDGMHVNISAETCSADRADLDTREVKFRLTRSIRSRMMTRIHVN